MTGEGARYENANCCYQGIGISMGMGAKVFDSRWVFIKMEHLFHPLFMSDPHIVSSADSSQSTLAQESYIPFFMSAGSEGAQNEQSDYLCRSG
jgi:hypothetical protein